MARVQADIVTSAGAVALIQAEGPSAGPDHLGPSADPGHLGPSAGLAALGPSAGPAALTMHQNLACALNSPVTVTEWPGRRFTVNRLKPSYSSRFGEHIFPSRLNPIVKSVTRFEPAL